MRNVKSALKKCLGNTLLSKTELITLLTEIEGVVNSRPLTQVTDVVDDKQPITPNHFLMGKFAISEDGNLNEMYKGKQKLLLKIWRIWMTDYLKNLPKVVPQFEEYCKLEEGEIVLVQDLNLPRLQWPLGRVVKTMPGRDGKIRSVMVKTVKGNLTRPVQRLCHLESVTRQCSDGIHINT